MKQNDTLFVKTKTDLPTEEILCKILNYYESFYNTNKFVPTKLVVLSKDYNKILKDRPDVIIDHCIFGMKIEII